MTTEPSAAGAGAVAQSALAEYQPGAVVSRTLLKNAGGNVTAFAFDQGEGLSEHTAPFEALVLGVEGEAEIRIADRAYRLRSGEILTLPARQPHAVKAITPFKMLLVMIKA